MLITALLPQPGHQDLSCQFQTTITQRQLVTLTRAISPQQESLKHPERSPERAVRLLEEVVEMETRMNIGVRWDSTMQQYQDTLKYITERRYHRALDHLTKLVTQRLFELHRLNVSGIGKRFGFINRFRY